MDHAADHGGPGAGGGDKGIYHPGAGRPDTGTAAGVGNRDGEVFFY